MIKIATLVVLSLQCIVMLCVIYNSRRTVRALAEAERLSR